ncbi:dihydroorotate dehydrogenase electron transfer subunit [Spiractinospora alimapuensis]|uniref:dihydroorotate dehydrogenase electron transfer subunit n=1 Tax=Spiractinospora alimapuensis TaxID=2820884 RepID=UPI001F3109F2|nr:dihydroorotate dehydrogenase electron transfer subunit [Spiractinospora alimapuensis]QVQ53201.1 dihydroorotate dehydrogenase electron transfer subunit [Spiractinospora alimapuensis]
MSDFRPVQVRVPVLSVRHMDSYHAITVVAPSIAERFRSGQFVAVAVGGEHSSMLLRRVFSIHDVKPDFGGTVEFVFSERGNGTEWLAERRARDLLDVVGPLGRPFPLPRDPVNCALVGEEQGAAALFPLANTLRRRGCRVDFALGGATADRVLGTAQARRLGETVSVATGDGSAGTRGGVLDLVSRLIETSRTEVVYASAPVPVLRSVAAVAEKYDIPAQVRVEEAMACGTGVCMGCVVPVVGEDGITRMARACVDGPVFRAERLRFGDVGTIPFDALGAPGWKSAVEDTAVREAG